jgi:general secretion pathway protein D
VALEVDLLFTGRLKQLSYGAAVPTSAVLLYLTDTAKGLLTLPAAVDHVLKGANYLALGLSGAELFASLTRSSATSLTRAQLVAVDGLPSTLHVGERYPVQVNAYLNNVGGQPGQIFAPPPQINFEELGAVLKITPVVHNMEEVTLEIEAEFKALGGGSFNGIPVISNRKYQGKVRVKMGQVAVLAGLVNFNRRRTRTGWPWISQIPYLGELLSRNTVDEQFDDTLLVITPRILSVPPSEIATRPFWLGSETHPLTVY